MPDSINFVRSLRKDLSKHQKMDFMIFRYVAIVGVITFVLFVGTLATRLFLVFRVSNIKDQETAQLNIIQSEADNERSYVIFAAKLQALSQLFVDRRNKQQAISYFSTLFGDTVLINNIKYEAENTSLTFGLRTKNIFTLNQVFDTLNSPDVQGRFKSLTYDQLTRDDNGEYQTNVDVVLKSDT